MSFDPKSYMFGGHSFEVHSDSDRTGLITYAYCPICGGKESSDANGLSAKATVALTAGKIRTHMKLTRKISGD